MSASRTSAAAPAAPVGGGVPDAPSTGTAAPVGGGVPDAPSLSAATAAAPLVSVIVPTYNNERFLAQCLDSAKAQTLRDIEVICVNDGSTDGSLAIMQDFAARDGRFRIIDKANGGYGHSMNQGLAAATGTYVAILESDDLIEPAMLAELSSCAEKNGLDFVKADFRPFHGTEASLRMGYTRITDDASLYDRVIDPGREPAAFDADMVTWTGIYRRSFLDAHAIRYNESPGAAYQDNGFWFQTFAFATKVMFVPRAYYLYRQDNPNSSINSTQKVFCMCEEHAFMHAFLERHPELDARLYRIWSKKMYHNYRFTYDRIAPEYREAFLRRFADDFLCAFRQGELDKDDFEEEEWLRLNDIMDDPVLSYRKYEDIVTDPTDRLVEAHCLRQRQRETDALRAELQAYRESGILRCAGALKRVNDYRRDYGTVQLLRRVLFKTPALGAPRSSRASGARAPFRTAARLLAPPAPALAYADGHAALDSEESLLCWYRRKTGGSLDLRDPRTLEEKAQAHKLAAASRFRELWGSLERVQGYAKEHVDACFLDTHLAFFDSFEGLENHLFERQPTSFRLRLNAKTPWEFQVFEYEGLDMEPLRALCRELVHSNLAFVAGENVVSGDEAHRLVMDPLPGTAGEGVRLSVCCVQGEARLVVRTPLPHADEAAETGYFHVDGRPFACSQMSDKSAALSLPRGMVESAMRVSHEFPLVFAVFEGTEEAVTLQDLNLGLSEGLIGDLDKEVLEHLGRGLKGASDC
ncbi:MAG: glycosyltransferase [Coriobacteriales bacterium]|jgi:glycosyltransferase involved in cell wall biosynthesis|nr:glycosyltransferase [Coriobacteriales bacterium]